MSRQRPTMNAIVALVVGVVIWAMPGQALGEETHSFQVDVAALMSFPFQSPESGGHLDYLGIPDTETFALPQLKTRIVMVQIFSMYCPLCQKDAPRVNDAFRRLEEDPATKGKVKFLGVGAGNTPFEVSVYRKKFGVPFPLVADDDMKFQCISRDRIRTPTFMVLIREKSGTFSVVNVHVGTIGTIEKLLSMISEAATGK